MSTYILRYFEGERDMPEEEWCPFQYEDVFNNKDDALHCLEELAQILRKALGDPCSEWDQMSFGGSAGYTFKHPAHLGWEIALCVYEEYYNSGVTEACMKWIKDGNETEVSE